MANWQHCPVVERHAQGNGGLWVFKGTDVPLYRLYEQLAAGGTVGSFTGHCGVDSEHAASLLDYEAEDFRADLLILPDGPRKSHPFPWLRLPEMRYPTGADARRWRGWPAR